MRLGAGTAAGGTGSALTGDADSGGVRGDPAVSELFSGSREALVSCVRELAVAASGQKLDQKVMNCHKRIIAASQ